MAFQTKTFLSIIASMVNRCRAITNQITDFNVGSVARTLLEAPAQEIDELYIQMLFGLLEAIQVSVYTSFNFPALPATPASNLLRVTIAVQNTPTMIASNSVFTRSDGSLTYNSTSDITIPAGATFADVPVAASVNGTKGNMPAGGTFTTGAAIAGFVSAVNLSAFINGKAAETPSAQKVRFNAYVQTLSRGTVASLLYALTNLVFINDPAGNRLEAVATANINEPYLSDPVQPPGLVNAFIHNGIGGTSIALVQQSENILNGYTAPDGTQIAGYKAAGVVIQVFAAGELALPVVGMLTVGPTFDQTSVVAQVTAAIYTYIQHIPVGQPYLGAVADSLVMQVPGVWNWMPVIPGQYVTAAFNQKLMPGSFQIIAWLAANSIVQTQTSGVLA